MRTGEDRTRIARRARGRRTGGLRLAAVAAFAALALPATTHARPDELPFEVAVVLRGCTDAPFAADPLVAGLDAAVTRAPLLAPDPTAAPIRLSFRAPRCGDRDQSVRIALEVAGGDLLRHVLEVTPVGATEAERSRHLAREAYGALSRLWPGILAAASGNPYVSASRGASTASACRRQRNAWLAYGYGAGLPPNPYRAHASELPPPNPYRD